MNLVNMSNNNNLIRNVFYYKNFILFLFLLFFRDFCYADYSEINAYIKSHQANKLYESGKLEDAETKLYIARFANPDIIELVYNLGVINYRKRNYLESIKMFEKVAKETQNLELKAKAYHNLGNSAYKLGLYQEAAIAYQNSLNIKEDIKTRYNLEQTLKKLQNQILTQNKNDTKNDKDLKNNEKNQQSSSDLSSKGNNFKSENNANLPSINESSKDNKSSDQNTEFNRSEDNINYKDLNEEKHVSKPKEDQNETTGENLNKDKNNGINDSKNAKDSHNNYEHEKNNTQNNLISRNNKEDKNMQTLNPNEENKSFDKSQPPNEDQTESKLSSSTQNIKDIEDVNLSIPQEELKDIALAEPPDIKRYQNLDDLAPSEKAKEIKNLELNPYLVQKILKDMEDREKKLQLRYRNESKGDNESLVDEDFDPFFMTPSQLRDFFNRKFGNIKSLPNQNSDDPNW